MYVISEVVILAVVSLLASTVFNTEYLFKWMAHNWKFYSVLGMIALLLIFLNKQFISAFIVGELSLVFL